MSSSPENSHASLTAAEGQIVAAEVAHSIGSGMPLDAALRAAASEASPRRVATALNRLAERIERGEPAESALAASDLRFPPPLRAILSVAARNGRLAEALAQWSTEQQQLDDLRLETRGAVAYPIVVLLLSVVTILVVAMVLGGNYVSIYQEFGIKVPWMARSAMRIASAGPWLLASLFVFLALGFVTRLALGDDRWNALLSGIPLVGPVWHWTALARWSRWLALLVDSRLPLDESLQLAATTAGDSRLNVASHELAACVARGEPLSRAMADKAVWPATAAVLVRWGEQSATLAGSLRSIADLCDARVRLRSRWTRLTLPPFAFVVVGFAVLFAYSMIVSPMIGLISMMAQ